MRCRFLISRKTTKCTLSSALIFLLFLSCSLKYETTISVEKQIPEMIAENASFYRTEDGKKKFELKAEKLEQYKSGNLSYAKDISFKSFDNDEKLINEGKSGYIAADTENEEYILLDDIQVKDEQHDMRIFAQSLRWNGKTEQLTSGKGQKVTLEKDNLKLTGKDFSSSIASSTFAFAGAVSGTVTTDEAENTAGNEDTADAINAVDEKKSAETESTSEAEKIK